VKLRPRALRSGSGRVNKSAIGTIGDGVRIGVPPCLRLLQFVVPQCSTAPRRLQATFRLLHKPAGVSPRLLIPRPLCPKPTRPAASDAEAIVLSCHSPRRQRRQRRSRATSHPIPDKKSAPGAARFCREAAMCPESGRFAGTSMRPGGFEPPTRGLEVRPGATSPLIGGRRHASKVADFSEFKFAPHVSYLTNISQPLVRRGADRPAPTPGGRTRPLVSEGSTPG
jgi:hypothetical protein